MDALSVLGGMSLLASPQFGLAYIPNGATGVSFPKSKAVIVFNNMTHYAVEVGGVQMQPLILAPGGKGHLLYKKDRNTYYEVYVTFIMGGTQLNLASSATIELSIGYILA